MPGVKGARPRAFAPLPPTAVDDGTAGACAQEGLTLLDDGFPWEAHERFEAVWNAAGRTTPCALLFQALAKIAASHVKAAQGSDDGMRRHRDRALAMLHALQEDGHTVFLNVSIADVVTRAEQIPRIAQRHR